tara:strand:+ start:79792 stop:80253 length:462 start_codon:yes stop_codon:yes gene_type:complete
VKHSTPKILVTWICLLSFVIHAALHIESVFSQHQAHSHPTTNPHSIHGDLESINSHLTLIESKSAQHHDKLSDADHDHAPTDHAPKNDEHDPTHHLKIQYRVTNQTFSPTIVTNLQQQKLFDFRSKSHQFFTPTQIDGTTDLNHYLNSIRLTL